MACSGHKRPLVLLEDGSCGEEPGPFQPDDEWVDDLLHGWQLIEVHGHDAALRILGGTRALDEGFCPLFWKRYEQLVNDLQVMEAEGRERDGAEHAKARQKE